MSSKKKYKIGDQLEDGHIFYISPTGERALVAAKKDYNKEVYWCPNHLIDTNASVKGLGGGFSNTFEIINVFEPIKIMDYAAGVCWNFGLKGYNWYLPSIDELELMYENLYLKGIGDFKKDIYWSSSDRIGSGYEASYVFDFQIGKVEKYHKVSLHKVRPIRAFNPNFD